MQRIFIFSLGCIVMMAGVASTTVAQSFTRPEMQTTVVATYAAVSVPSGMNVGDYLLRALIAAGAGVIGATLLILVSEEETFRSGCRKWATGVLASTIGTGIALRYVKLDPNLMDFWVLGGAGVGFGAWYVLKYVKKWLLHFTAQPPQPTPTLPIFPQPPVQAPPSPPAAKEGK